jgi:hypothetical protein
MSAPVMLAGETTRDIMIARPGEKYGVIMVGTPVEVHPHPHEGCVYVTDGRHTALVEASAVAIWGA